MSIHRTLQLWLLAGVTLCTLATGWLTYRVMRDEANELFDRQLRQIVITLPHEFNDRIVSPPATETEDDIVVQVWNEHHVLRYVAPAGRDLPRASTSGFTEMVYHGHRWRIYALGHDRQFIQAAQPIDTRDELAGQMALGATAPFLLLIPVLLLLIWLAIRRGLRPLSQVASAVSHRSLDSLQPIDAKGIPSEIRPLVAALNDLLSRLDSAWSAQRHFVADAAHELRTPLTALRLQLQRAEKAGDDTQRAIAFSKLHERLERTTHVVQQLLTLARQEPSIGVNTKSSTDLISTIESCVAELSALAEAKQITLELECECRPVPVAIADESLRVLLDNLIDNAIRYTPASGHVKVSVAQNQGQFILTVADSGPGIAVEDRERVFDRFYRHEDSGETGSGLGLAIVKTIVERYGAQLELGDAVSGGAEVQIRFNANQSH